MASQEEVLGSWEGAQVAVDQGKPRLPDQEEAVEVVVEERQRCHWAAHLLDGHCRSAITKMLHGGSSPHQQTIWRTVLYASVHRHVAEHSPGACCPGCISPLSLVVTAPRHCQLTAVQQA